MSRIGTMTLGNAVMQCNYMSLEECKLLADRLARVGPAQTVYKHPNRQNYNITFTERHDLYKPEWIVYQTGGLNA